MPRTNEETRIIEKYQKRDERLPWNDWRTNIYHQRHPVGHLFQEHNHDILVSALNELDLGLAGLRILDIGCGYGSWLRYLVELGADSPNCVGVDLSQHRLGIAKQKNPAISWCRENVAQLSFPDGFFDLVLQSVVFSSILDAQMRMSCALEMCRITRQGGIIFWIDLVQASSPSLVTFSEVEVRNYFPGLSIVYRERVHPAYFRRLNGRYACLAKSIYQLTKYGCESQLLVFRKSLKSTKNMGS